MNLNQNTYVRYWTSASIEVVWRWAHKYLLLNVLTDFCVLGLLSVKTAIEDPGFCDLKSLPISLNSPNKLWKDQAYK